MPLPWKRKCIGPWANLPFGPTGHTYIPDLVIEVREVVNSADLVRHDVMYYAPWTKAGRDIALLDMKRAWEVRMPGGDQAIALVILLRTHQGDGDLVSIRPRHVALERRDRTLIVTRGDIDAFRGSDPRIAFSHLADRIIDGMSGEQLDTLYRLSGAPQVPPAVPRLRWLDPGSDRIETLLRHIAFRVFALRAPTRKQSAFVEAAIRSSLVPGVPSFAKEVCGVATQHGETVAVLRLFDDALALMAIPEANKPELGAFDLDRDDRPFHFDWHRDSWFRIDALAA